MDLLILGFPQSGKTTVFIALTNRHASTAPGGGGGATGGFFGAAASAATGGVTTATWAGAAGVCCGLATIFD